jgi:hypothetical protein
MRVFNPSACRRAGTATTNGIESKLYSNCLLEITRGESLFDFLLQTLKHYILGCKLATYLHQKLNNARFRACHIAAVLVRV